MGRPVITVPKGGLAVVAAPNGLPVEESSSGFGLAVTQVPAFGLPVTYAGGAVAPPDPGPLVRKSPDNMTDANIPAPYVATGSEWYTWNPPCYCFNSSLNSGWLTNDPVTFPAWIAIDLGAAASVKEYTLQAMLSSNITWQDWTMQGSPDGRNWTLLDTQVGANLGAAGNYTTFTLPASVIYRFWRWNITKCRNYPTRVDSGNIGLWGFQNLDPVRVRVSPNNMTANNAPPPFVASSQSVYDATNVAYKCFSGIPGAFWAAGGNLPQWYQIDLGAPAKVSEYEITSRADGVYHQWLDWTFAGSPDGSVWTTLDTVSLSATVGLNVKQVFALAAPATFRYWRWNVTRSNLASADCGPIGLFRYDPPPALERIRDRLAPRPSGR